MTYKPYTDIREFTRGHPQQVDWLTMYYYSDLHWKSLEEVADIDALVALLYNIVNCYAKDEHYEGDMGIDWHMGFIKDKTDKLYVATMDLIDKQYYALAKYTLFRMSFSISSYYEFIYSKVEN